MLVLSLALLGVAGGASAQTAVRNVRYRGLRLTIPRSWPVYNLTRDPRVCVRFDRHALYLGTPGTQQRCPAHAAGRTEAILVQPRPGASPRAAGAGGFPLAGPDGRATDFTVASAGVEITATWSGNEGVVERALHRRSLPGSRGGFAPPHVRARAASSPRGARAASAVYEGLGFDACQAPSESQMAAWGASPYRALGVYIGGVNSACSQPNLTSSWVATEVGAGWHLIPTYVGLQAPSNSCGCAAITPSQAAAEGSAAANDAAADAAAIGIPAGNPIYDDMEAYSRNSTNTQAVLSFLSAWTSQLHTDGYASGVYSSDDSGITDLVNAAGSGYIEPDDIWIANWNGQQTTSDPNVPAGDWSNQQRLHQYRGAHDETYDGVTINVDNDYLDGATADTSSGTVNPAQLPSAPPTLTLSPLANGTTDATASWSGAFGVATWRVLAGYGATASAMSTVGHAAAKSLVTKIAVHNSAPYFAVEALNASGQVLGTSAATAMPPHVSLFGPTTFVPAGGGLGALPAGCFTGTTCVMRLTLRVGRSVIASTGNQFIGSNNGGLLYFKLTPHGRTLLARAPSNRLTVQATARDVSGASATMKFTMIAFTTSGRPPARHVVQSPTLHLVGATEYVSPRGVGGALTMCRTASCQISTTVKVGRVVVAHTGLENLGANELGYLIFTLTSRGRALLRGAAGNQLPAQLTVADGSATASARIILVGFH